MAGNGSVNLEQVLTVTLVPLGMAAVFFLVLVGLLWGQLRAIQRRMIAVEAQLRAMTSPPNQP